MGRAAVDLSPPPRRDILIAELLRQKDRLVVAPSAKIGGEKKTV